MLQLRLHQVYEHCGALGVAPDMVYALVVVDASLVDHPPLERNAARVALAAETKGLFSTGETVAVHGDRVLVLASRTPELEDRVAILGAALHTHPLLRHDLDQRRGWSASRSHADELDAVLGRPHGLRPGC